MPEKRKRNSYTLEDRERALQHLILNAGNAEKAHATLSQIGLRIPRRTIDEWRRTSAERYAELQTSLRQQLEDKIAAESEALIVEITEKEREIIRLLDPTLIPPKELAGSLRNLSTSKALQVDKVQGPLRGRPVEHHHTHSPDELLAKLTRALGPSTTIPGDAIEVPNEALLPESAASNVRDPSSPAC